MSSLLSVADGLVVDTTICIWKRSIIVSSIKFRSQDMVHTTTYFIISLVIIVSSDRKIFANICNLV